MFSKFYYLEYLNFSNFDTKNVLEMDNMFYSSGVKELDLSTFYTPNLISFKSMFRKCTFLKKLN